MQDRADTTKPETTDTQANTDAQSSKEAVKPVVPVQQTKSVRPAPMPPNIKYGAATEGLQHIITVPASVVNGTNHVKGEEQFPDMLGGDDLPKSTTMPAKDKSVLAAEARAKKISELNPNTQYTYVDYVDDDEVDVGRCAKYKPKCRYILKELAIGLDATFLKPLAAFPMGYLFSELNFFKDVVVSPGFAGYVIHNLLEVLAQHKKDDLRTAMRHKPTLIQVGVVGTTGLVASVLAQSFLPIQDTSVGEKSLNVALPGFAMGLANHAYTRYVSKGSEKLPRSYLTHFAQKVLMVGLDTVQAAGFTLFFHELAKFSSNDANRIFSHCVAFGWSSTLALKLLDVARFRLSLTKKERDEEIYNRAGTVRGLITPEVVGYSCVAISYFIASATNTMGFSFDTNQCLKSSADDVLDKTAKLALIYGMFRLPLEYYRDKQRGKLSNSAPLSSRSALLSGGDLEANLTTSVNRATFADEDPVTTGPGYEPPGNPRPVNGRGGID